MNSMHHHVSGVSVRSKGPVILPCLCSQPLCWALPFLPALVLFCLRKMLFWTWFWFCLCITPPTAAPTTWFCPVVVSEPGFEARRAVNPLLMGCGLAESSGKGRKSQLRLPHLFVCLTPVWKPFYFSFALGQYQAMAGKGRMMPKYPRAVALMLGLRWLTAFRSCCWTLRCAV